MNRDEGSIFLIKTYLYIYSLNIHLRNIHLSKLKYYSADKDIIITIQHQVADLNTQTSSQKSFIIIDAEI